MQGIAVARDICNLTVSARLLVWLHPRFCNLCMPKKRLPQQLKTSVSLPSCTLSPAKSCQGSGMQLCIEMAGVAAPSLFVTCARTCLLHPARVARSFNQMPVDYHVVCHVDYHGSQVAYAAVGLRPWPQCEAMFAADLPDGIFDALKQILRANAADYDRLERNTFVISAHGHPVNSVLAAIMTLISWFPFNQLVLQMDTGDAIEF